MEIHLKTISQMVGPETYTKILENWVGINEKKENILKEAISKAYVTGFKDGQK